MYENTFEYLFEEALRKMDEDEGEVKNRPQDDEDDWQASCLSEETHKRMLERASREYREEMEEIRRIYHV